MGGGVGFEEGGGCACYGVLRFIMESGAKGSEVIVSGMLTAQCAKSMKFKDGYMHGMLYHLILSVPYHIGLISYRHDNLEYMISSGKLVNEYIDSIVKHVLLRQATLGNGKGEKKSVLQCNVGNKSPILLCSLIPNVSETCHLELEFEEDEEVVFSVLGQMSVHLSGYYLSSNTHAAGDETDSYGEDIGEEDSDSYGIYDSEEDEYESDFIDDGDVEMFSPSPQRKSSGNLSSALSFTLNAHRQLVVKSNNSTVLESEDEDGFPIFFSLKKKSAAKNVEENEKPDHKIIADRKRKIDVINVPESAREIHQALEIDAENKKISKKKKNVKDQKPHENGSKSSDGEMLTIEQKNDEDATIVGEAKVETEEKDLATEAHVDVPESDGKLKKREKNRAKMGKTSETSTTDFSTEKTWGTDGDPSEAPNTEGVDQSHLVGPDEPSNDKASSSKKQKKKNKKKKVKDGVAQDGDDVQMENENIMQISLEDVGKTNENLVESQNKTSENNAETTANAAQEEAKKKKKKKSKNKDKDLNANHELPNLVEEEKKAGLSKMRTFANGLTIEELAMGKPDGKRASPGCKVSVNYIGKFKNGKIFDSNVGQKPFKFRLGIGQVIKGWDVGVNGMRVGDKRRLTIPPSMGYGEKGLGKIPGNSWLVFDVELVAVQ
ncbi:peptidyl-prolyl cis-trans isomerase FKBP53 [Cocos nucifera]|uniref:peptidylprolyl isomerase n=1 Tax=Cocos nucifera TaxID=13894 RepID=A0A8K0MYB4_COCNU|nr:peptidyl-prolyl cis-trans isomerase FKBP53 [Cocos nucifera]